MRVYGASGSTLLEHLDVHGNVVSSGSDCSGVVHLDGVATTLRDVDIHDNAITCGNQTSGWLSTTNNLVTTTLERVFVRNNTATIGGTHRGAVFLYNANLDAKNLVIAGNTVTGTTPNRTVRSMGINGDGPGTSHVTVVNADIVGNTADANCSSILASSVYGGGGTSTVSLTNVVSAFNTSAVGSASRVYVLPAGATVTYGDVYGNDPTTSTDWGSVPSGTGTSGNFAADPAYASIAGTNANSWDLTPTAASPLLDAGDPAILDIDGSRSDVGAYGGPNASW